MSLHQNQGTASDQRPRRHEPALPADLASAAETEPAQASQPDRDAPQNGGTPLQVLAIRKLVEESGALDQFPIGPHTPTITCSIDLKLGTTGPVARPYVVSPADRQATS
jgi:hypothetical protein